MSTEKMLADALRALQGEAVTFPMVNVIRCVCCEQTWEADAPEKHLIPCASGDALKLLQDRNERKVGS